MRPVSEMLGVSLASDEEERLHAAASRTQVLESADD